MNLPPATISVVIPALNEGAGIGQAIGSCVGAQQVIVADGGSNDKTVATARELGCEVVCTAAGRGSQLRAGAELAVGELLVFLHADNRLEPAALQQLRTRWRDAVRHRCPLFGCFRQRIEAPGTKYRCLELGNHWRARWLGLPYGDQAQFIDRDTYHAIDGMPDVPLMEDVMLARRAARRAGVCVLPGPVYASARRWQRAGVLRQTLRNWCILSAFFCGVPPATLRDWYR